MADDSATPNKLTHTHTHAQARTNTSKHDPQDDFLAVCERTRFPFRFCIGVCLRISRIKANCCVFYTLTNRSRTFDSLAGAKSFYAVIAD